MTGFSQIHICDSPGENAGFFVCPARAGRPDSFSGTGRTPEPANQTSPAGSPESGRGIPRATDG